MTIPIDCQIITDAHGQPAFAVIPYGEFIKRYTHSERMIPHEVISATVDGVPPMKAWREYLGLTQAEVAERLTISQSAFAQLESSANPRKSTLRRVAQALGVTVAQLDF